MPGPEALPNATPEELEAAQTPAPVPTTEPTIAEPEAAQSQPAPTTTEAVPGPNTAEEPRAEATAEVQAENQPEQPRLIRRMTAEKTAAGRVLSQQSAIEPAELAKSFALETTLPRTLESLKGYFATKQENGLFKFAEAEKLAQEILQVEEKLVGPFQKKLKETLTDLTPDQLETGIAAMRETVFALIMNDNKMSAEKICEFLDGHIQIQELPGDEVKGSSFDPAEMVGSCAIERGQPTYYIYKKFFTDTKDGQSFNWLHEMSHGMLKTGVYPKEVYDLFLDASKTQTPEALAALKDYPELQEVAKIVGDPKTNSPLFREYIQKRMEKLVDLQGEPQATERSALAEEILADYTTYFLKAGNSTDSFMFSRIQHLKPEALMKFIESCFPGKSSEAILTEVLPGINLENLTNEELIDKLSVHEKLAPLFKSSKVFAEAMEKRFAEGAKGIKITKNPEVSGVYDEDYAGGGYSGGGGGGSENIPYSVSMGGPDLVTQFLDWVTTGKKAA